MTRLSRIALHSAINISISILVNRDKIEWLWIISLLHALIKRVQQEEEQTDTEILTGLADEKDYSCCCKIQQFFQEYFSVQRFILDMCY